MPNRKITAVMLAFAFILLPMSMSFTDSTGELTYDRKSVHVGSFNERSSGTLSIPLENSGSEELTVDVYVTWLNGDYNVPEDRIASVEGFKVPAKEGDAAGTATVDITFRMSSPGKHYVTVSFWPENYFPSVGSGETAQFNTVTVEINVDASVWNNASIYVLIAIAVIAVIVAVYLRMRSTRVPGSEGRFTAMEAERRSLKERLAAKEGVSEMSGDAADDTAAAVNETGAERQEYTGRASKTKRTSSGRKSGTGSRKSAKRK